MGWQLEEAVPAGTAGQATLCVRMGPLFRLRLAFAPVPGQAPTAHASVELTRPGISSPPSAALDVAPAMGLPSEAGGKGTHA